MHNVPMQCACMNICKNGQMEEINKIGMGGIPSKSPKPGCTQGYQKPAKKHSTDSPFISGRKQVLAPDSGSLASSSTGGYISDFLSYLAHGSL